MVKPIEIHVSPSGNYSQIMREVIAAARNATKVTIKDAARVVAETAKTLVAEDTGLLKSTIQGKSRKARGEDRFIGTVSTATVGKMQSIGSKYKRRDGSMGRHRPRLISYGYGRDQEIGHTSGSYKFKPFLRPALVQNIETVRDILKANMGREAVKHAARRGRPPKATVRP